MASNFGGNPMGMQSTQSPATAALQQMLIAQIQQHVGPVTGWQAGVNVGERFSHVWQMVSQLRLVNHAQYDMQKICTMALQFEKGTFDNAQDKETYVKAVREKMNHLTAARTQIGVNTQAQIHAQSQHQAQQAQRQAQAHQMNMVNQGNLQGQLQRTGMGQQPQQPFHHLQHQMQASPIPGPQQQQVPMGMVNNGLPPNLTNQQQQQFQMNLQQQQQQLRQQQQQAHLPPEKRSQSALNSFGLSPQDQNAVNGMVQNMLARMPEEEKQNRRNQFRSQMEPSMLAKYTAQNVDVLPMMLRSQAVQMVRQRKLQNHNDMQLQRSRSRPGVSNAPSSTPMQQQMSGNPVLMNGQPPSQMGMNQDFGSFVGDMMGHQQAAGVLAQDAGQMVVPPGGPQGNGIPQMGANGSRPPSNSHVRSQPTQQALNAEQAQSQAQMRANASAKAAQHMALQGQPGGMGPMPPSQSPAMSTLNAPLRTPQQAQPPHPADPLQLSQSSMAHFGAPLDPRYAQVNQQRGNPSLNGQTIPLEMSLEAKQKIMALPKDKLNEVLGRWHASKPQAGITTNVPGARPNPQPNQAGQFNRPGMPNQFMNGNQGGQPPQQQQPQPQPTSTMTNLTAQQQQAISRAKMAQHMPPQRGPNGQALMNPQDQAISQIDHLEFPPGIKTNNQLLRQAPPNLKRWGELKQWVLQNDLATQGNTLESVKNIQKMHFTSLMRSKNIQQDRQRVNGLMNGTSMGPQQSAGPVPGMAPVAHMVQPPQVPGGISGLQISAEDIQNARSHSSGRYINATDEEIKQMLVKNHYSTRQRDLLLQQRMEIAQRAQPQPGNPAGPPRTGLQRPPTQAPNGGRPQPAAPPAGSQPPGGSDTTNQSRATRPAKTMPPASSSQPPKNNLKRASSDDLVEVPNPNSQQHPRPTAQQQTGNQQKPVMQVRGPLGANPPASWTPEQRKQYAPASAGSQGQLQSGLRGTSADAIRFQSIMQEELTKVVPLPTILMTPEVKRATDQKLSTIANKFKMVKMSLPKWFAISKDEDRLRKFLRWYYTLSHQFHGPDLTEPLKEKFSITPVQIDQAYSLATSLVTDLSNKFPGLSKSANGVAGAGPAQNTNRPVTNPGSSPAVPLNAANLQQQQKALSNTPGKSLNRGGNRSNNAPPPPPTSAHPPPFPPEAFAPPLTVEQLRLPKSKKQKVSASSTPVLDQKALSTTSAQPAKQPPPEEKPPQLPEPTEPKKTGFYCPEPHCDHHFLDEFPDAEALERHREEEHVRPVQDPKKYALDHLASITNVNHSRPVVSPQAPGSKVEKTPAGAVSTPMNRQRSANGPQASPGSRTSKTPKSNEATVETSKNSEQDFMDLTSAFDDDLWADSAVNPQDLVHNFEMLESGAAGAISDMNVYRSITPNDTPESSKDGLSEPTSDISEGLDVNISLDFSDQRDWRPFGLSDMENLLDLESMNVNKPDRLDRLEDDMASMVDAGYFDGDSSQFVPWNEFMDPSAFDKPFSMDQTFFSLNAD